MEPLDALRLRLTFSDGLVRELDLDRMLDGGAFEPLRDPAEFAKAAVDEVAGTVSWSNGIDLDPDVLHGDRSPALGLPPAVLREYTLHQTGRQRTPAVLGRDEIGATGVSLVPLHGHDAGGGEGLVDDLLDLAHRRPRTGCVDDEKELELARLVVDGHVYLELVETQEGHRQRVHQLLELNTREVADEGPVRLHSDSHGTSLPAI